MVTPMVERSDFLEGALEALRKVRDEYGENLYSARFELFGAQEDQDAAEIQECTERLMDASRVLLSYLDDEITHIRWKLSAARKREAAANVPLESGGESRK